MNIYINSGHSSTDPGACNTTLIKGKTITERELNRKISNLTIKYLKEYNLPAQYIEDDDPNVLGKTSKKDDIFVSIHHNGGVFTGKGGTEVYYKNSCATSKRLATLLSKNVVAALGLPNRGILEDPKGWAVVRNNSTDRCALIEVAFMQIDSNVKASSEKSDAIAKGIADAIYTYYKELLNSGIAIGTTSTTVAKVSSNTTSSSESTSESSSSVNYEIVRKLIDILTTHYFSQQFTSVFSQPGYNDLFSMIRDFLTFFFFNIFSIPNLPNAKVLIAKPEIFFGAIPSCNIITPVMVQGLGYTRVFKSEPTRLFLKSSPMGVDGQDTNLTLGTIVGIDTDDGDAQEKIIKFLSPLDANSIKDMPMYKITSYEDKYGIRIKSSYGGSDIFSFLLSQDSNEFNEENAKEKLVQLAKYLLLQARFKNRVGTVITQFNPYIAPGFPLVVLGDNTLSDNALTIYGYVDEVEHVITGDSASTTIAFSFCHTDTDPTPTVYPIIEDAYDPTKGLSTSDEAYKEIFGEEVSAVDPSTVIKDYKNYTSLLRPPSLESMYAKIRRYATKLEDFIKLIFKNGETDTDDGTGTIVQNKYMCITSSYYRPEVQKILKTYSSSIYNGYAISLKDII